jgi:hypothetical protein
MEELKPLIDELIDLKKNPLHVLQKHEFLPSIWKEIDRATKIID